jgi:DUF1009 family protein
MANRLGIIAGSGKFPFLALKEARKQGFICAVAGIRGDANPRLAAKADSFEWMEAGEISRLLDFFIANEIREAVMAGKIDPRSLYRVNARDGMARELLSQMKEGGGPAGLIKAVISFLGYRGIEIKDPTFLLRSHFCPEGILTDVRPSADTLRDIELGWKMARGLADLDIGQTVILKDGIVVAVEGIEGTDKAILRGAKLAGRGIVVVKVSRTLQDPRVDLPGIGLGTIRTLVKSGASTLCIEADRVVFFEREKALALANASQIAILAKK